MNAKMVVCGTLFCLFADRAYGLQLEFARLLALVVAILPWLQRANEFLAGSVGGLSNNADSDHQDRARSATCTCGPQHEANAAASLFQS